MLADSFIIFPYSALNITSPSLRPFLFSSSIAYPGAPVLGDHCPVPVSRLLVVEDGVGLELLYRGAGRYDDTGGFVKRPQLSHRSQAHITPDDYVFTALGLVDDKPPEGEHFGVIGDVFLERGESVNVYLPRIGGQSLYLPGVEDERLIRILMCWDGE